MKFQAFTAMCFAAAALSAQAQDMSEMTFVTQGQELNFKRPDQIKGEFHEHSESNYQFAQDFRAMAEVCIRKLKQQHGDFDAGKASMELSRNHFVGITTCTARIAKSDLRTVRVALKN